MRDESLLNVTTFLYREYRRVFEYILEFVQKKILREL